MHTDRNRQNEEGPEETSTEVSRGLTKRDVVVAAVATLIIIVMQYYDMARRTTTGPVRPFVSGSIEDGTRGTDFARLDSTPSKQTVLDSPRMAASGFPPADSHNSASYLNIEPKKFACR